MKVEMKEYEVWCRDYSQPWNKKQAWDFYCLIKDAYINGFKKCKEEAIKVHPDLSTLGETTVEIELAGNQIGSHE